MALEQAEQSVTLLIPGSDEITWSFANGQHSLRVIASLAVQEQTEQLTQTFGGDPRSWPMPQGSSRGDMILREFIARVRGEWQHPYPHDEICHCRAIGLTEMEEAIFAGARDIQTLKACTTVASSCGTCQPDVEKVLEFRLTHRTNRE